ncbi:MAG: Crp/Fnr family transcriptional regulator [Pedobacter sp.]|uniref:Crp/Fnr family transcriptional regulator n=1 Tax=Pedobacter sp. TaxID=1411316 RepID=UPI0033971F89
MIQEEFLNYVFNSAGLAKLKLEKPSSLQWLDLLTQAIEEKKFPKGHSLLNIGQTPELIYFLRKGAISGYYLDADGKRVTLYLWCENAIVTDIAGYINQTPSDLRIYTCDTSEVAAIHRSAINRIIDQYPEALLFIMAIQGHFLTYHRERDMDSQTFSAEERYRELMATDKKLALKFSKKFIASLLGVSPSHFYELMKRN